MVAINHLGVAPANAVANIELAEASHGQRQVIDLLNHSDPFLKRLGHPPLQDVLKFPMTQSSISTIMYLFIRN